MEIASTIQTIVGTSIPVLGATWYLASKLSSMDIRLRMLERAVFDRIFGKVEDGE